jgi:hypothetical protein
LGDSSEVNTATYDYESFRTNDIFSKACTCNSIRKKLSEILQDLELYKQFLLHTRVKEALQAMQISENSHKGFVTSLGDADDLDGTIDKFQPSWCKEKVTDDQKNSVQKSQKKLARNLNRLKCIFEYHKAIIQYDLDLHLLQTARQNEKKQNTITRVKSVATDSAKTEAAARFVTASKKFTKEIQNEGCHLFVKLFRNIKTLCLDISRLLKKISPFNQSPSNSRFFDTNAHTRMKDTVNKVAGSLESSKQKRSPSFDMFGG